MEEWLFFDIMRKIILWSCPVIFLLGVTLLVYSNYSNFEAFLVGNLVYARESSRS